MSTPNISAVLSDADKAAFKAKINEANALPCLYNSFEDVFRFGEILKDSV